MSSSKSHYSCFHFVFVALVGFCSHLNVKLEISEQQFKPVTDFGSKYELTKEYETYDAEFKRFIDPEIWIYILTYEKRTFVHSFWVYTVCPLCAMKVFFCMKMLVQRTCSKEVFSVIFLLG